MATLSEILRSRGYVYQHSSETLEEITDGPKRTLYWGVDPSADSMHAGQLMGMLVLRRFVEDGHKLIIIVGGGTGMIGDPGGKSAERNLLSDEVVDNNARELEKQFRQILGDVDFEMINNAVWLRKLNLMEFLRDIGKHFTVNEMIKRDTIRPRLETPDQSISYTEFSYMLLQAYDYLELFKRYGCNLQVGGSDQWGNMLPGIDLIRRKAGEQAYVFSWPLLVDKTTGKKFGKSEGNAVWLDAKKTSPYQFYQFWLNVDDAMVEELLFKLTLLSAQEISAIMDDQRVDPAMRVAQKRLAQEVTALVHGKDEAEKAEKTSLALFSGADISEIGADMPSTKVSRGISIVEALVASGLASSKREARQFLEDGAVSINGEKVGDRPLSETDFKDGKSLLKRGKRNVAVLELA
jgi:tyrosyl-tRNA synthetase